MALLIMSGCSSEFPPLMTSIDATPSQTLDSMASMTSGQMDASAGPVPNQADATARDADRGIGDASDMGRLETPETECNEQDDDGDGLVDEGLEIEHHAIQGFADVN